MQMMSISPSSIKIDMERRSKLSLMWDIRIPTTTAATMVTMALTTTVGPMAATTTKATETTIMEVAIKTTVGTQTIKVRVLMIRETDILVTDWCLIFIL